MPSAKREVRVAQREASSACCPARGKGCGSRRAKQEVRVAQREASRAGRPARSKRRRSRSAKQAGRVRSARSKQRALRRVWAGGETGQRLWSRAGTNAARHPFALSGVRLLACPRTRVAASRRVNWGASKSGRIRIDVLSPRQRVASRYRQPPRRAWLRALVSQARGFALSSTTALARGFALCSTTAPARRFALCSTTALARGFVLS